MQTLSNRQANCRGPFVQLRRRRMPDSQEEHQNSEARSSPSGAVVYHAICEVSWISPRVIGQQRSADIKRLLSLACLVHSGLQRAQELGHPSIGCVAVL